MGSPLLVGFWTCLPLLLVTFTGLYFAFPKPVATLTILASGGSLTQARTSDEPAPQAVHPAASESAAAASTFSVDDALTRARQLLPVAAPPAYLTLPGPRASSYYVTGYYRSSAPFAAGERDLRRPYRGSSQPHGHSRADPR